MVPQPSSAGSWVPNRLGPGGWLIGCCAPPTTFLSPVGRCSPRSAPPTSRPNRSHGCGGRRIASASTAVIPMCRPGPRQVSTLSRSGCSATCTGGSPRAHTRGRGWTDEQLATGEERLRARGLLDGDAITHQGREVREAIETSTDAAMAGALAVLGDDVEEILTTMEPWGAAIRDAGGYLTPLVRFTFANT